MNHSFDIKIAEKYGIQPAIILNYLYFWIEKNKANEQNFYDGYYWTYNSKKAFATLFPYMTARQIDYAMKKLIDEGLVITGNYNKLSYDRTLWYAITNKGYSILQNCEMEKTELSNGVHEIVKPIPDINTDINTNIKQKSKKESKANTKTDNKKSFNDLIDSYTQNETLRAELKEHLKIRKSKKSALTNRAIELSLKKLDDIAETDEEKILIVQNAIMRGWTGFFPLKDSDRPTTKNKQSYDIDKFKNFNIFAAEEAQEADEYSKYYDYDMADFYKTRQ